MLKRRGNERRFRKLGKDRRDKIATRCVASSIRKAIIASFYLAIALAAISSPLLRPPSPDYSQAEYS